VDHLPELSFGKLVCVRDWILLKLTIYLDKLLLLWTLPYMPRGRLADMLSVVWAEDFSST
jgi:hypothetical protein